MPKIIILVLGILLPIAVFAQDSKRESVEELLRVSRVDSMVDGMYAQMHQVFNGMAQELGVRADEQELFDAYMNKLVAAMKESMTWESMKETVIDIYLKHYSEKEIQDMLAFYKTESGRSMVEKMPAVMADSMVISQQLVQSFLPRMKSITDDFRKELQAHRQGQ